MSDDTSRECEPQTDQPAQPAAKRTYEKPQLVSHGRLDELTRGGNPVMKNDPGGPSTGKF